MNKSGCGFRESRCSSLISDDFLVSHPAVSRELQGLVDHLPLNARSSEIIPDLTKQRWVDPRAHDGPTTLTTNPAIILLSPNKNLTGTAQRPPAGLFNQLAAGSWTLQEELVDQRSVLRIVCYSRPGHS